MDLDTLAQQAALLPRSDQQALLERLVDGLTNAAEQQVAAAWDDELQRRADDLDSGAAATIPWEEVSRRLHALRTSR